MNDKIEQRKRNSVYDFLFTEFGERPSFAIGEWKGGHFLHYLISSYHWDDALELLNSDVDDPPITSIPDEASGDFPLHMALKRGAPEILTLKIINSCDKVVSQMGNDGCLPLHLATIHNSTSRVILTIMQKFPKALDLKDNDGDTPRNCMRKGIDANARDALMKSVHHWESMNRNCSKNNSNDEEHLIKTEVLQMQNSD